MMRRNLGVLAAVVGVLLSFCILLGMLGVIPLMEHTIIGETLLRFLTQFTVVMFLIAAWGFWEI